jgi:signal transduction histidine kinase
VPPDRARLAVPRWLARVALVLVAPAIGLAIQRLPGPDLGPPYLLFCPPILVAALLGGPWCGLASTALAAILAASWVISAGPVSPRDAVSLTAFVASGLLVTLLAHLHRKARDRAVAAELRAARARLEASEERLRHTRRDAHMSAAQLAAVIHAVQDGISLADRSGRFALVNAALARVHGFAAGEEGWADLSAALAGLELAELDGRVVPGEGWPTARALRGESFVDWELRARRLDTGRTAILSFSGAPIRGEAGTVELALVVTRDVTGARRAEEAQRLESVGRLAGGVAHDFNNLLTVILSGVSELRRSPDDRAAAAEIVEEIGVAGARARELVRHLLAFARKQAVAPVHLDVSDVVREAETLLRRLLGQAVVLSTRLSPGLWPVCCDRGQLEQIILNLAVNARDAMPAGGRLCLATANVEGTGTDPDAPRAELPPGQWVQLTVSDDGEGMAPEVREHIFEPFFTTKPQGKGMGLGLAIVYGIVVQNDGLIRVDSEPGRGTTFHVLLPRAAAGTGAAVG